MPGLTEVILSQSTLSSLLRRATSRCAAWTSRIYLLLRFSSRCIYMSRKTLFLFYRRLLWNGPLQ